MYSAIYFVVLVSNQNGVKIVSISPEKSVGVAINHIFDMQCDNMLSKKYFKNIK